MICEHICCLLLLKYMLDAFYLLTLKRKQHDDAVDFINLYKRCVVVMRAILCGVTAHCEAAYTDSNKTAGMCARFKTKCVNDIIT